MTTFIYKHKQIGYVIIISVLIITAFIYRHLLLLYNFRLDQMLIPIISLGIMFLFSSLTVIIDEQNIILYFGPGVFKKKFLLKDIESFCAVKNSWYCGWGIRIIENGWLYNVSGFQAVELKMKSGKIYRIGTDEPENLKEAIKNSLNSIGSIA